MIPTVRLDYGFNEIEDGFVWSTYEFGLSVAPNVGVLLMTLQYPNHGGQLTVYDGEQTAECQLNKGQHLLALNILSSGKTSFRFSLEPRVSNPHDVRDLGLLIQSLDVFGSMQEVKASIVQYDIEFLSFTGTVDSEIFPIEEAEVHLASALLDRFVDSGWFKVFIFRDNEGFGCETAFYPPLNILSDENHFNLRLNGDIVLETRIQRHECLDEFYLKHIPRDCLRAKHRLDIESLSPIDPEKASQSHVDFSVHGRDGTSLLPWQAHHWRGYGDLPMPSRDNIFRVAGDVTPEMFSLMGATWAVKLQRLVEVYGSRGLDECSQILDWGCGCGRILRFFPTAIRRRVMGADIDPTNIEWCRRNLSEFRFELIDPSPPTSFENEEFDVIFGHSVFTHLTEEAQFAWLQEISRILSRDGLCFLTVMSELSWFARFKGHRSPRQLAGYLRDGIVDDGHLDVGVDSTCRGSYRSISHTTPYIVSRWSEHFDIIDIIEGFADIQSLIILRRRLTNRSPAAR